ncbi:MAG: hypothetical protein ACREAK_10365 [Nitrosarchaeum sp.]
MELPKKLTEYDRKVSDFLTKIGFSSLDSGLEFKKSKAEIAREIDLLFTYQNCLFIIEVSTVQSGRNYKILAFMYRWSKRRNLERIREKHPEIPNNVMRIFFDLSKDTPENKSQDVEESTEDPGNMVIYKDVFDKLYSNKNTEQTITDFLGQDWFDKSEKFV